jgi:hypothetical protein
VKYLDNSLLIGWVQYAICLSPTEYAREMRRLNVKQPTPFLIEGKPATTHFFSPKDDDSNRVAIVCLCPPKDMDSIGVATLLVHEAVHIWQEEREMMGEESPGHEIEAYAIQRISSNLLRAYAAALPKP